MGMGSIDRKSPTSKVEWNLAKILTDISLSTLKVGGSQSEGKRQEFVSLGEDPSVRSSDDGSILTTSGDPIYLFEE